MVDTEIYTWLSASGMAAHPKLGKSIIKRFLKRKYCKKILGWSEDAKKSFQNEFPNDKDILDKIEVMHFALEKRR